MLPAIHSSPGSACLTYQPFRQQVKEHRMSLYDEYVNEEAVPVIFADAKGVITAINQRFAETFHWSADQLVGKPISTIIPAELHDAHNMGFSRYALSHQATLMNTPLDLRIQLGTGEIMLAEHLIVSMHVNGEELFAAKITPR